jgi:hypothetical protein
VGGERTVDASSNLRETAGPSPDREPHELVARSFKRNFVGMSWTWF